MAPFLYFFFYESLPFEGRSLATFNGVSRPNCRTYVIDKKLILFSTDMWSIAHAGNNKLTPQPPPTLPAIQ